MRFNSLVFVEFACLFFLGWAQLGRRKPLALVYVVLASWLFYGYETWWFVPLLVTTATVDWGMALAMDRWPTRKRVFLWASCLSNLSALGMFKYMGFFAGIVNGVLGTAVSPPNLLLPIGISFYTFQSLSYVFDVYRGKTAPTKRWLEFLAIVSLFAHLIAGPIVRVSKILPQVQELRRPTSEEIWSGIDLICVGFFKKMVLADRLGGLVDIVYRESRPSGLSAIFATMAFAFEIYYDFAGYTDIARGLAKWLGLDFGINFDHPYGAIGMSEFWSRWHISLSTWVRDYLYIPLGGDRSGAWRTHRNLWISLVLAGLWHGANWTFVVWGVLHAFYLSFERLTEWPKRVSISRAGRVTGSLVTFLLVCVGWVFFRAETLPRAFQLLQAMASPWVHGFFELPSDLPALAILIGGLAYEAKVFSNRQESAALWQLPSQWVAARNGILLALCIVAPGTPRAFIYFQF
ncbi:MAG: MBOAT family O-acyltransferase [Fimbriimonas sp.]|nr:MBOAT family O-acyltransferase [Fimbriimonas sp.]